MHSAAAAKKSRTSPLLAKARAGSRAPKKDKKTARVLFRITPAQFAVAEEMAARDDSTVTHIARKSFLQFLRDQGYCTSTPD